MKFKILFPIMVCFFTSLLKPISIQESSTPDWTTAGKEDLHKAPVQLPTGAETLFGEWLRSTRLDGPKSWVRVRAGVVPKAPEQLPVGTEAKASFLPYPLDQLWAFLAQKDQPQVTAGVDPEGPEQLPLGTEGKASSLPSPLDQLWAYLTQPYTTSLFSVVCETMFLHCMAWIACYIWRNMKKPQGQGRGRTATSPVGTDRREGGTVSRDHLELLRRLEINTALLNRHQRLFHRRQLDELWHQFSRI